MNWIMIFTLTAALIYFLIFHKSRKRRIADKIVKEIRSDNGQLPTNETLEQSLGQGIGLGVRQKRNFTKDFLTENKSRTVF
jgi:hypothetical protein